MKKNVSEQANVLKKSIEEASKKSKESIKKMIDTNSSQFETSLDLNKRAFDSIAKLLYEKELDPSIVSSFKKTFGNATRLSEEVIDSIIDSHTKRMDMTIDFSTRLMEALKEIDFGVKNQAELDNLLKMIKENFDESVNLSVDNMKKVVDIYNKHLNFAFNFNKKFADTINDQVEAMFRLQNKNIGIFNDLVSEWWKQAGKPSTATV